MPASHYQVIVVGSGPVGLTLVNLLGRIGIGTLLVERNQTTVQEPRAVSIDDESLRTMQAAGVVDDVLRFVVPGYGSHYYSPGRVCFAKVEPTGKPFGYPRRNAFRQPILEGQLKRALDRFANVDQLYGWRMARYVQSARRVMLELTGPEGEEREVTCDYLVGCDGAASGVREQQGVQLDGTTFDERWLIVDLENNENTITHTEVFCDKRRPCITLPGPDRTRRFEFKLLPGETDDQMLGEVTVQRLLRAHGADPAATLRRKVVYRFHARVAPRWSFGRVFLAGDAAHLTPPFAGQGMNSGVRDAHNLAWKLAAVLRKQVGPGLLNTYEQERKDHVWQMINIALRMGRIMSPRSRLRGLLTQSAFLALNIWPPARDYVTQMKYKPRPSFHDGFLLADHQGRRSLVGRLLPQPIVRLADGHEVLLDYVIGDRFAVIARTTFPAETYDRLSGLPLAELDVRFVFVMPVGSALPTDPRFTAVAETDPAFTSMFAGYDGYALLLRPDHYVVTSISLAAPAEAARAIEAMLASTWTEEPTSGSYPGDTPEPQKQAAKQAAI